MSEGHIIVAGATVYCSQSLTCNSPATAVPLNITSQTLVVANGNKAVATEKDNNDMNMNFGRCNDPKYASPSSKPLCKAEVTWNNCYEPISIGEQKLRLLTEKSEGICNICSVPGRIKFAYHGQTATVTCINMSEANKYIMTAINPLVSENTIKDIDNTIRISEM